MSNDNPPADHVRPENTASGIPIEENIKSRSTWLRLLFMFVFYVIGTVTTAVLSVVVLLGFFWVLFTGEKNGQLPVGQLNLRGAHAQPPHPAGRRIQ